MPNQSVTKILDLICAPLIEVAANERTQFSSKLPSFTMEEMIRREPFLFDENVVFRESSFFKEPNASLSLPTPTEVREVATHSENPRAELVTRPSPVIFPGLGMLMKYGTEVSVTEGQCSLFHPQHSFQSRTCSGSVWVVHG
jgi:hypothetical protein